MAIEITNPVIANWTPMLIKQEVAFRSGQTPTAERLNELFNLNIEQGDLNTKALTQLIHDFYGVPEYTNTYYADLDALIAKTNTALNTIDSNVTKTLEIANAKLFELKDKLNLLEVSTNEYQFEVDTHLEEYDGKLSLQAEQFNITMQNNKTEAYAMFGVSASEVQALISDGGITARLTANTNSIQQVISDVNNSLTTSITQQRDRIDIIAENYLTAATLSVAMERTDVTNVLKSVITAQADEIRMKAGTLVVQSNNFTLTQDGVMYTTMGILRNCYVYGSLYAVDAELSFTSDTTGNKMLIANGKLVTDGMIGIYNNDIYCQDLYIKMNKAGLDKASNPNDPPSSHAINVATYIDGVQGTANSAFSMANAANTAVIGKCDWGGTGGTRAPDTIVSSNGLVKQTTGSSMRYKQDIQRILAGDTDFDLLQLYNANVWKYRYKPEYIYKNDERAGKLIPGFISEEIARYLPIAVDRTEDGEVDMWNSHIIIPAMFALIKDLHTRVTKLEETT